MLYIKQFLKVKFFLIVLGISFLKTVKADSHANTYSLIFKQWGIETEIMTGKNTLNTITQTKSPQLSWEQILETPQTNQYVTYALIVTSQVQSINWESIKKDKVIIICDTTFTLNTDFSCDFFNNYATETNLVKITPELNIGTLNKNKKELIVIPALQILSSYNSKALKDYIQALDKSTNESLNKKVPTNILNNIDDNLLEVFAYILILLVFITLFGNIIKTCINQPNILTNKNTYIKSALTIKTYFENSKTSYNNIIMLLGLLYVLLLCVISIRDTGSLSLNYIFEYIYTYNKNISLTRDILYLYQIFLAIILVIRVIPNIITTLSKALNKFTKLHLQPLPLKVAFILTITLLIFMLGVLNIKNNIAPITLLVAALVYINHWIKRDYFTINNFFTPTEKLVSFFILTTVTIISSVLLVTKLRFSDQFNYQQLFDYKDNLITLPYIKSLKEDTKFLEHKITNTNELFVNNYQVIHPKFKTINNISLDKLDAKTDNIQIINTNDIDLFKALILNSTFKDIYVNKITKTAPLYLVENFFKNKEKQYYVNLNLKCSNYMQDKVYLKIYHKNLFKNPNPFIKIELVELPQCFTENQVVYNNAKIPIDINSIPEGLSLITLESKTLKDSEFLDTDFSIYSGDTKVNIVDIGYPENQNILYTKVTDPEQPLNVYSTSETIEISFTRNNKDTNIAKYINELIDKNAIKNSFTLWSDKKFLIVRNIYDDDK